MRRSDKSFDPFSESPVDGVIAAHCSIQVGCLVFLASLCRVANAAICFFYYMPTLFELYQVLLSWQLNFNSGNGTVAALYKTRDGS